MTNDLRQWLSDWNGIETQVWIVCMRHLKYKDTENLEFKRMEKHKHAKANWKKPSVVIRQRQDEIKQGISC